MLPTVPVRLLGQHDWDTINVDRTLGPVSASGAHHNVTKRYGRG